MEYRLTNHAREMMEERRIEEAWVARVLARPDHVRPDPRGEPLQRAYGVVAEADGRVLRVVYWQDGPTFVVVTAHFDRGARQ